MNKLSHSRAFKLIQVLTESSISQNKKLQLDFHLQKCNQCAEIANLYSELNNTANLYWLPTHASQKELNFLVNQVLQKVKGNKIRKVYYSMIWTGIMILFVIGISWSINTFKPQPADNLLIPATQASPTNEETPVQNPNTTNSNVLPTVIPKTTIGTGVLIRGNYDYLTDTHFVDLNCDGFEERVRITYRADRNPLALGSNLDYLAVVVDALDDGVYKFGWEMNFDHEPSVKTGNYFIGIFSPGDCSNLILIEGGLWKSLNNYIDIFQWDGESMDSVLIDGKGFVIFEPGDTIGNVERSIGESFILTTQKVEISGPNDKDCPHIIRKYLWDGNFFTIVSETISGYDYCARSGG